MQRFPCTTRIFILAALALSIASCAGRSINKKTAHRVIVDAPADIFDKEDVDIRSASQTGSDRALVEAELRAAFAMERIDGQWVIREVRLGKRPWERIEDILAALERVKAENTKIILDQVMAAVESYRESKGSLPNFQDYIELTDALCPTFMTPLIRLDAWRNPLFARRAGNRIRIVSGGPDGRLGNADDLEVNRTFQP
jgi:hypothetical protein